VHYLRHEHRGISAAMNAGIRASVGPLIARIDSDDCWLPDLLETEVSILEARPEIGLVYAKGQWTRADLTPLSGTIGHPLHFPEDSLRSMLWADATCNITAVVRRECFHRTGWFDDTLATSEDWDMWLRMAVDYQFYFVDRVLAYVRGHDGEITGKTGPSFAAFLDSRHKVLDKFFSRDDLPPHIAAMRPVAYRNLYVFVGNMWVGAGNWSQALPAFVRAIRAGGNPVTTAARIAWFSLAVRLLSRSARGRAFLRWQSNQRLRQRAKH
jgi:glycosyltransferase involved in cell wall biosynthesis